MNLDAIRAHYDDITAAISADTPYEGPALFVRGGQSDYIRDEDWSEIQSLFPNAELRTVAEAGHWVHADAPEALADIVTEFVMEGEPV
jgi:pimeloyl-ACP methyl ester carboxylesterase